MKMPVKNYLLSKMNPLNQSFKVKCTFILDGDVKEVEGVLDTGCSRSLVSAGLIYDTYEEMQKKHIEDIQYHLTNRIPFQKAFGVESTPEDYREPTTLEEALENKNIRFPKHVSSLRLNRYYIGDVDIQVSYTLKGLVLIGMDILKRLHSFIGPYKSQIYFLATRKEIVKTSDMFEKIIKEFGSLSSDEDEYLDFFDDQQLIESNYINQLID